MTTEQRAQSWLDSQKLDPASREKIEQLKQNHDEFSDAFYKDLEFGTGGPAADRTPCSRSRRA